MAKRNNKDKCNDHKKVITLIIVIVNVTIWVRSLLEFCTPLWAGNLTKKSVQTLNRVEKSAFKIIFPNLTYDQSASALNIQKISERRVFITRKFAKRMAGMSKFSYLFKKNLNKKTRHSKTYTVPRSLSNRHKFSPIQVFLKLLNGETKGVFRN